MVTLTNLPYISRERMLQLAVTQTWFINVCPVVNYVQNISISDEDNSGLIVSILTDVYNKSFPVLLKLLNLRPGFILRRLMKVTWTISLFFIILILNSNTYITFISIQYITSIEYIHFLFSFVPTSFSPLRMQQLIPQSILCRVLPNTV